MSHHEQDPRGRGKDMENQRKAMSTRKKGDRRKKRKKRNDLNYEKHK